MSNETVNESGLEEAAYQNYVHYNVEMESAIIGAMLREGGIIEKVYPLIEPDMFYRPQNKLVYKTLRWMFEKHYTVDIISVAHFIHKHGLQKWNDVSPMQNISAYLTSVDWMVVSTASIVQHSLIVRELYINRLMLQIKMEAGRNNTLDGAIEINKKLEKAFRIGKVDSWLSIEEVITKKLIPHMDSIKGKTVTGAPTGFRSLDKHSPCEKGDYIVLAARPSIGKTAFAMQLARSIAGALVAVGVISLETRSERLAGRLISGESGLEYWKIWKNNLYQDEENIFHKTIDKFLNAPIFINDEPAMTAMDIRIAVKKLKGKVKAINQEREKLGLPLIEEIRIIIDYLQLVTPDEKNKQRHLEVGDISRMCKLITLEEEDVGLIALAQIGRSAETEGEKKPRMRHLKESGNIEQDADKIWLLHRDRDNEQKLKGQNYSGDFDAFLIIDKNKEGWTGEIPLKFKPEQMSFYEEHALTPVKDLRPAIPKDAPFETGYEQQDIF